MQIRHIGVFVKDIGFIDEVFSQLGLKKVYDEIEIWGGKKTNIKKYLFEDSKIELIQGDNVFLNTFHLSFNGDIPNILLNHHHYIMNGIPFDKNIETFFVFIDDSIYFEFVREKI